MTENSTASLSSLHRASSGNVKNIASSGVRGYVPYSFYHTGDKQAGDEIFEKGPEGIYTVWSAGRPLRALLSDGDHARIPLSGKPPYPIVIFAFPSIGVRDSTEDITMDRSEEHTSELQSHSDLVCRL